jgi:hypothetical protein
MSPGETSSSGAPPRRARTFVAAAMVVAATLALCLVGCRVALRFDEPEAGTDAPPADWSCTSDQQCASPFPRCSRPTGRCVGCLSNADCSANQFCDPDSSRCRTDL